MSLKRKPETIPLKNLPRGGTIGVTAPASPVKEDQLNRGVSYLEKLGYRVHVGKTCYSKENYVAGDDHLRATELMNFIHDPDIDAIFCARGGYGTIRILDRLDYQEIRKARKLLVGFSDITALQWAIYAQTGLITVSGGMVATDMAELPVDEQFESCFWELMNNGIYSYDLSHGQEQQQEISGKGIAGTLSMGAKLLGTPYVPNLRDSILLLEDVQEPYHKIEGYLMQFVLSRAFKQLKAVLIGAFTKVEKNEYEEVPALNDIFHYIFDRVQVPVVTGVPYGHIPSKIPLPVGATLSLSLGPTSQLKTQESIFEH